MFQLARADLRVETANAHGAGIGIAQALQDLDGGGFASAIGAEQAKDFTFVNSEAEAAHGLHIAVVLHEIFYLQNGIGHKA